MTILGSNRPFQPQSPDAAGVISWVHLGDPHMTKAGEQTISIWQRSSTR